MQQSTLLTKAQFEYEQVGKVFEGHAVIYKQPGVEQLIYPNYALAISQSCFNIWVPP